MLDESALRDMGFKEPKNFWSLNLKEVEKAFGAYVILRRSSDRPTFLETSTAGTYRKDPTTQLSSELYRRWVSGTSIIYIGAAGLVPKNKTTLRGRISAYRRYGQGQNGVSHEGGNRIWQLEDVEDLLITWKPTPSVPGKVLEDELLELFEKDYKCLPFANGRH
jgi:hypothetical protein